MNERKSRLSRYKQMRLIEHFVAGTTARTAAQIVDVHRNTSISFYMRNIISFGLAAILILTGCNHHGTDSKAPSTAGSPIDESSELPSVAEIVVVDEGKCLVGGWVMNAEELKRFISGLPEKTEVVIISNGHDFSFRDIESMLDERGLGYTVK